MLYSIAQKDSRMIAKGSQYHPTSQSPVIKQATLPCHTSTKMDTLTLRFGARKRPPDWEDEDLDNLKKLVHGHPELEPEAIQALWPVKCSKMPLPDPHNAWIVKFIHDAKKTMPPPPGWDETDIANLRKHAQENAELTLEAIKALWNENDSNKPLPDSHKGWATAFINRSRQALPMPPGWDDDDLKNLRKLAKDHPTLKPKAIKALWNENDSNKPLPDSHNTWATAFIKDSRRYLSMPPGWDEGDLVNLKKLVHENVALEPEAILALWDENDSNKPVPESHNAWIVKFIDNAKRHLPMPPGWDKGDLANLRKLVHENVALEPEAIQALWQKNYSDKPLPESHKAWATAFINDSKRFVPPPPGWDEGDLVNLRKLVYENAELEPEAIKALWKENDSNKPLPDSHKAWATAFIYGVKKYLPPPPGWDETDIANLRKLAQENKELKPTAIKALWKENYSNKLLPKSHNAWIIKFINNAKRTQPKPSVSPAQTTNTASLLKRPLPDSQYESGRLSPYARSVSQVGEQFQNLPTTSSVTSQQWNNNISSEFDLPFRSDVSELHQKLSEALLHRAPMSPLPNNEELLPINMADQQSMMASSIASPSGASAQPVTRRGSFSKTVYTFIHPNGATSEARDFRKADGTRVAMDSEFKLLGGSQRPVIASPSDSSTQPVTRRGSFSKTVYTFTHPNGATSEARDFRKADGTRVAMDSEFKQLGDSQHKPDLQNRDIDLIG